MDPRALDDIQRRLARLEGGLTFRFGLVDTTSPLAVKLGGGDVAQSCRSLVPVQAGDQVAVASLRGDLLIVGVPNTDNRAPIAATLNANWSTGTGRAAASYYRDRSRVWLQGGVKRDSGATTSPFTLPSGYRPTQTGGTAYAIVDGAGAVTYATVSTAGVLTFGAVTTGTALNLDGISFRI